MASHIAKSRAARSARSSCSGVSRYVASLDADLFARGAEIVNGTCSDQAGSHGRSSTATTVTPGAVRSRGRSGPPPRAIASSGPATSAAPASMQWRRAAAMTAAGCSESDARRRSMTSGSSPAAISPDAAHDVAPVPLRSRTWISLTPPATARSRTSVFAVALLTVRSTNGVTRGSTESPPNRNATTASGTRSGRVRNGRSGSSISTRPCDTSGPCGVRRARPSESVNEAPHSSSARPIDARRRVRSSCR